MRSLYRVLNNCTGAICALVLFAMIFITVVDVAGRYLFNRPLHGAFELSELLLSLAIFSGLPAVTASGTHITVDLWISHLSGTARRGQRLLSDLMLFVTFVILTIFMFRKAADVAAQRDATAYLNIPLSPVAYFMSLSCAACAAVLVMRIYFNTAGRKVIEDGADISSWQ